MGVFPYRHASVPAFAPRFRSQYRISLGRTYSRAQWINAARRLFSQPLLTFWLRTPPFTHNEWHGIWVATGTTATVRTQLPESRLFPVAVTHILTGGRSEHLVIAIQLNSCPEITVYDSAPIRCRTASRASETLVRRPCSTRCLRNCSFMPPAVA
jgi:hypothetical protein